MVIDEEIMARVNSYVKKLTRRNLAHFMDAEDIRQELLCELIISLKSFDKNKGEFLHFVNNVLRKRYFMLLEKYGRAKKGRNILFSEYNDNLSYFCEDTHFKTLRLLDLEKTITRLPKKYRDAIFLFRACNTSECVSEILKMTRRPRSSVYADIRRAKDIIKFIYTSGEKYSCFNNKIGEVMKNISILETLSAKEISRLEPADLMELNDQVTNLNSQVKEMRQKLDDGLNLRFAEAVKNTLKSEGKDTGTTRFFDGAHQIIAEVPKKVTWDSEKMEGIIKQISDERRKDLIKVNRGRRSTASVDTVSTPHRTTQTDFPYAALSVNIQ